MSFDLRFTHIGLFVRDLDEMGRFYEEVLGFVETDRGTLGAARLIFLSRDPAEHHQIVFVSGLPGPPQHELINQISLRIADLESLLAFHHLIVARGVADIQPVNHGNAWSVYFRDPENNRLEVYTPSPWYIPQPCREPLQIERTADEIRSETEAWCRRQPGFALADAFSATVAAKIAAKLAQRQA